jgi:hypothetical protein
LLGYPFFSLGFLSRPHSACSAASCGHLFGSGGTRTSSLVSGITALLFSFVSECGSGLTLLGGRATQTQGDGDSVGFTARGSQCAAQHMPGYLQVKIVLSRPVGN